MVEGERTKEGFTRKNVFLVSSKAANRMSMRVGTILPVLFKYSGEIIGTMESIDKAIAALLLLSQVDAASAQGISGDWAEHRWAVAENEL